MRLRGDPLQAGLEAHDLPPRPRPVRTGGTEAHDLGGPRWRSSSMAERRVLTPCRCRFDPGVRRHTDTMTNPEARCVVCDQPVRYHVPLRYWWRQFWRHRAIIVVGTILGRLPFIADEPDW